MRIQPRMADLLRTEKQKMLAGQLYNALDPELVAERLWAEELLLRFNTALPQNRDPILRDMVGSCGQSVVVRSGFACDYGYNIHLGANVFLNYNCVLLDVNPIHIGQGTQIGPAVQIYAADHPRDAASRGAGLECGKPVTVGCNVWIGGGAVLLPGITIGDHAVLGAGSIVTRDVAPGVTVAGNPARRLSQQSSQGK